MTFDGATYQFQMGAGCPSVPQEVGRPVYVRSLLPLGSPGTNLILLEEDETCAILSIRPPAVFSGHPLLPPKS